MGKSEDWGIPLAIAAGGFVLVLLGFGGTSDRLFTFLWALVAYFVLVVPWLVRGRPSPQDTAMKGGLLLAGIAVLFGAAVAVGYYDPFLVLLLGGFALLFTALGCAGGLVGALVARKPTDRLAAAFLTVAAVAIPYVAIAWMELLALAWTAMGLGFAVAAVMSWLYARPRAQALDEPLQD